MSQGNLELIRAGFAAHNRGDLDAPARLLIGSGDRVVAVAQVTGVGPVSQIAMDGDRSPSSYDRKRSGGPGTGVPKQGGSPQGRGAAGLTSLSLTRAAFRRLPGRPDDRP